MSEKLVAEVADGRLDALGRRRLDASNLIMRGVEKESLRVTPDGMLASTPHPRALGSALMHPQVTTDFSESQLELITGVHPDPDACIAELNDIHRFVFAHLGDELIWPASMPCMLPAPELIPIGQYGTSNKGMTKTVYRRGLANRYGPVMQTISGIHYNFSVTDDLFEAIGLTTQDHRTAAYFGLIRNFRRYSWLLIYLFGASPAVCRSFGTAEQTGLAPFDEGSLHLPHATSLRMGPLGYQSDAQRKLHVSYNSLDDYAASIRQALSIHHPPYTRIGTFVDGEYRQLSDTLIQIENEFYGTIRPKRPLQSGERPLTALTARGVGYVEVRCLDLNPFLPVGIDTEQMRFIDTFLLYCLLADSPPDSPAESARMHANQIAVVQRGREPGLTLQLDGTEAAFVEWAGALLDACVPIARWLDDVSGSNLHATSLERQRCRVLDPQMTPAAAILDGMRAEHIPFFRLTMRQAEKFRDHFLAQPLTATESALFDARAEQSLADQHALEAADAVDFATHLASYLRMP